LRIAFVVVDAGWVLCPNSANSSWRALSPKLRIMQDGLSASNGVIFQTFHGIGMEPVLALRLGVAATQMPELACYKPKASRTMA